jgi:hypothetical protein
MMTAVVRAMLKHHTDVGVMSVGCLVFFTLYAGQADGRLLDTLANSTGGVEPLRLAIEEYMQLLTSQLQPQQKHQPPQLSSSPSDRHTASIETAKIVLTWIKAGATPSNRRGGDAGPTPSTSISLQSIAEDR